MESDDIVKREVQLFTADVSSFLTLVAIGVGCLGVVRLWSDVDFLQLDMMFAWLLSVARMYLLRLVVLSLSLLGTFLLIFSSIYYLVRVYKYLRYITPVIVRKLYVLFSLLFAASSTMYGLFVTYISLVRLSIIHYAPSVPLYLVDTATLLVFSISISILGLSIRVIGKYWRESRALRTSMLLFLTALLLLAYPYGMSVSPFTFLLSKSFLSNSPRIEYITRNTLFVLAVCTIFSIGMMSSLALQHNPILMYRLPVCPKQIYVDVVQMPGGSDDGYVQFILVITNPSEYQLNMDNATLILTIGNSNLSISLHEYHSLRDEYSLHLLYCDNCGTNLTPRVPSMYVYRVNISKGFPSHITVDFEAFISINREGHIYTCGKYSKTFLLLQSDEFSANQRSSNGVEHAVSR